MSAPERTMYVGSDDATAPTRMPFHHLAPGDTLFGRGAPPAPSVTQAERDFRAIRDSAAFADLRRRTLRFVVPATVLFMGNYMLFVLLSAYAPRAMGTPVFGLVNAGTLLGMAQFVSTMLIVGAYCRYARHRLDPLVETIRDEVEPG